MDSFKVVTLWGILLLMGLAIWQIYGNLQISEKYSLSLQEDCMKEGMRYLGQIEYQKSDGSYETHTFCGKMESTKEGKPQVAVIDLYKQSLIKENNSVTTT